MSGIGDNSGLRWIALSVDARFHPLIGCGRAVRPADASKDAWSRFEAWVDLICEASWKQREVVNKGKTILLERGELMAARGWLALRWNWTEKQVRGFIDRLEAEFMVQSVERADSAQQCGGIGTKSKVVQQNGSTEVLDLVRQKGQQKRNMVKVLSICNYDLYQTASELNSLLEGQRKVKAEVQQLDQQKGQQRASKGPDLYKGYNTTLHNTREPDDCPGTKAMLDRMTVAGGEALANPASAPALLTLTELNRWLRGGCDFEQDILPGIRKAAAKKRQASIFNWLFFEEAILELRNRRLTPVPEPVPFVRKQVNGNPWRWEQTSGRPGR